MNNTPINPRAMSRLNAAALAVSLQGAIDEGEVKGHAKMRRWWMMGMNCRFDLNLVHL